MDATQMESGAFPPNPLSVEFVLKTLKRDAFLFSMLADEEIYFVLQLIDGVLTWYFGNPDVAYDHAYTELTTYNFCDGQSYTIKFNFFSTENAKMDVRMREWWLHAMEMLSASLALCEDYSLTRAPFHWRFFHRNSNSMEISFHSHLDSNTVIATKFCTWLSWHVQKFVGISLTVFPSQFKFDGNFVSLSSRF